LNVLVQPGNASHIGQREQQQDAFALSDFADAEFVAHGGFLAVLADGIGGLSYGDVAADIASSSFLRHYVAKPRSQAVDDALDTAFTAANQAVLQDAQQRNVWQGMGATLVAAVIYQDHLYWRAVGDSHLYLCRGGRLSQLNADHNFARSLQLQVNEGLLSQEEADMHPDRKALECFVGLEPLGEIERNAKPLPLHADDRVLLCSDGIYGVLSAEEIVADLALAPMDAAQRLCERVLNKCKRGQDNLTAVVLGYRVSVTERPRRSAKPKRNRWLIFAAAGLALLAAHLQPIVPALQQGIA
jgi:serine/threonine protein phosphatase PrpC